METPLVSVVCVTYNHEKYISQCLDSFLMQETNFDYEIILGEDESKDGTREICISYAEKHPKKIRLFLRSREDVIYINGQATGRYNLIESLKACKGKYIALCEGDDYWTDPLKLQKQVDLLEQNADLIACHHWQKYGVYKEGSFFEVEAPKNGHGYYPHPVASVEHIFANQLRVKSRTILFRNVITNDFFPDWFTKVAFGDVPLTFLLGKYGDFGFIDEEMAVYRQTGKGSSTAGKKEMGEIKFRQQHFKNWIKIWDYANKHYDYQYKDKADNTVRFFYDRILDNVNVSYLELIRLLQYNWFMRFISTQTKMAHSVHLLKRGKKLLAAKKKK